MRGGVLDPLDGIKHALGQPVIAHGTVISLYVGILLRLPWLDMLDADMTLLGPVRVKILVA